MIPVTQRQVNAPGVVGDCFKAALVSILELDYDAVPHFVEEYHEETPDVWVEKLREWLLERGLDMFHYGLSDEDFADGEWVPHGFWIASVTSPRNLPDENDAHAVVMHGKELVHDPHPGPHRGEHRGFRAAFLFFPLDPAA